MGIFCYLLVLSDVVGDSSLAMVVGVLCGGFDTGDVLLDDFFCVGARILYELHCVHCVAGLASKDMTAGGQRFVLSLQSGSDDHFGRLVLHLLVLGWCTCHTLKLLNFRM